MRHGVDGRKFGRNTSHRTAMFRNLANSVIEAEQIVTTIQKAKEARRLVDRWITLGKTGTLHARRLAFGRSRNKEVVEKIFDELAKRYAKRPGGYTRIMRLSDMRRGDAAEMAILELVDHPVLDRKRKVKADDAAKQAAEGAAEGATQDPFSKFRKLFKGQKKAGGKTGEPTSAKAAKKSTTVRKTSSSA